MLVYIFMLIGLLAAGVYSALAGFVFWKALLIFLAGTVAANLIYLLWIWVNTLFVDTSKPLEKQNAVCRRSCVGIGVMCTRYAFVRTHVSGLEKLPKEGGFLLVLDHRSMYDPIVMADKLRDYNVAFVSKFSNMHIPIVGRMAYGAGYLPIDRENDREALKTILTAADYIKRGICNMVIFPEGTRSKTGEMLPFHAGSFKIAQKANCPLAIASLSGTEKVSKNALRRPTDVYLNILEVIPADEVKRTPTAELAERSRALIEADLEKQRGAGK